MGTEVYPLPPAVTVIAETAPLVKAAVAFAPPKLIGLFSRRLSGEKDVNTLLPLSSTKLAANVAVVISLPLAFVGIKSQLVKDTEAIVADACCR